MPKTPPSPILYAGEFRHAIDSKHRVTVPARWRSAETEEFFTVPDPQGAYLMMMPPAEFERVKALAEDNPHIPPADKRKFIRRFYSLAQVVSVDRQGRVLLSEEHCRMAGLHGEVVLIGSHSRMEIWNPQRWAAAMADEDDAFRRVAGEIGL